MTARTHNLTAAEIRRPIARCPYCGSANTRAVHTEAQRDPDDGDAIVHRRQYRKCSRCKLTHRLIDE